MTPAGFVAGQYSTFTSVRVNPAPTVIGTVPVTTRHSMVHQYNLA